MIPLTHRRLIGYGVLILLAGMPFHAFLSIYLGSLLGNQALWQSWKEILIVILAAVALDGVRRSPKALEKLMHPFNYAAVAFGIYAVLLTLIMRPPTTTALFGLKTDLEFLVIFIIAQLVIDKSFERLGQRILIYAASIVSAFAILQSTILPPDFLASFGYSVLNIDPHQTLLSGTTRAFSTTGGPNQLGAFLILPIALTLKATTRKRRWAGAAMLTVMLLALFFTYSRSAWLGTLAAIAIVAWFQLGKKMRYWFMVGAIGVVAGLIVTALNLNNELIVHGGGTDQAHVSSVVDGLKIVAASPLGLGLGTAGPASFRGDGAIISENFYIQIAIETGILGIGLFIALHAALAKYFWKLRAKTELAGPLLSALVGVSIVNLFLHGWADSSAAITFWALAGLSVGTSTDV